MSLLVRPSLTRRTTSCSAGVSEAQPLVGLAFGAAPLGVGDRFLDGQGRALSPRGVKVMLAQGITRRRYRGVVAGVIDFESHRTCALPDGVCRAEQPRGFVVAAGIAGQGAKAL